ncbi:MAG: PAS domain-containing sensor histidine kinase [Methanoregula sp.]|nr:PAS domain-containing sensor histidine kinase [Methanoregula sp.]
METALILSEQTYHSYVDNSPGGFFVADGAGQYLDVNRAACNLLGYSREELLSMNVLDLALPEEVQQTLDQFTSIIERLKTESSVSLEIRLKKKDGSVCPVIMSVVQLPNNAIMGFTLDITDRKRMEEALRQANKQLNLLSSITRHDILNQLMALKGYLYLSKEMIDNPTTLTGYIQKEEQAADAIENQIKFTRDYQELGVAAPEWQNVNSSIEKALLGLPMRAVRVEVDPKNPYVFADRLFEKVFYNLIDNALRYGGADMKTIRVSSQESDSSLTILCEDDGVGITAEDKKRLFTKGFGKNTGLGLFLSREILAITSIKITETGVPGKGARFEITVPKGMYRFKGGDH